jgi:hypothetical protein
MDPKLKIKGLLVPVFAVQGYLSFPCFFNALSLGPKEDLLHVTHCIISLLPYDQNSFMSELFQYVMNMYCLYWLHVYMLRLFKTLLINEQMSMQKVKLENHDGIVSMLCTRCSIFSLFLFFIGHKLYTLM